VRRIKDYENKDPYTKGVFPVYITGEQFEPLEKLGSEADTSDVILSDGEHVKYHNEGNDVLVNGIGGFLLEYPRDEFEAFYKTYLEERELTSPSWQTISFFWVYVNRNHDFIVG
jgi:hypothetical protein